jgi:hypothetical protein
MLAMLLVSCVATPIPIILPTIQPTPTPRYLKIVFDVIDEVTGQPITAGLTIRRERLDGSQIEGERFYTGQHLEIEAPIDPNERLFILAEADGYQDWEVGMRINKGGTLKAPIRLKRIATPTPTLSPQG